MYKNFFILFLIVIILLTNLTGCTKPITQSMEEDVDTLENSSDSVDASVIEKVDTIFMNEFDKKKFNGYVLITRDNKILFEKSYGMADNEKQIPITKESTFDIASLTKQFTSVGIMMLQEKGLLNVKDTIDNYICDFPNGDKITIHHLLTHTSGVPNDPNEFDLKKFKPNSKDTKSEPTEVILHFDPGKSFEYSSPGYILLGYIIESVSGQSLDDFFKENIFEPLGMNNTEFKDENYNAPNLTIGYNNYGEDIAQPSIYDIEFTVRGGGGLCTSAQDLQKWNNALYSDKLLSQESIDKIFTPNKAGYGYGYFITINADGTKIYEHYGTAAGYRSYIMRKPGDKTCIIILSNYQDSSIEEIVNNLKNK